MRPLKYIIECIKQFATWWLCMNDCSREMCTEPIQIARRFCFLQQWRNISLVLIHSIDDYCYIFLRLWASLLSMWVVFLSLLSVRKWIISLLCYILTHGHMYSTIVRCLLNSLRKDESFFNVSLSWENFEHRSHLLNLLFWNKVE